MENTSPTTWNRPDKDVGKQHQNVVFITMKNKRNIQHPIEALNKSGAWNNPVVTTLEPITKFYQANR
ncbi:MAG: peptide-methionine (S)-S-oxide reductase [Ferruginibacter sp.]|nr:peptide-methionine (S)-S-oxide reductase [Ferruginibacter sp.]